jgi:uncharacterized protein YndB with AHSA1/START domain
MKKSEIVSEPGKQELFITREFDAPREVVFYAYTNAKYLKRWASPRDLAIRLELFEPITGGSWAYTHLDEKGREYHFRGVFHEVAFPDRIVQTLEYGGFPEKGHAVIETAIFEILPNERTKVTTHTIFQSNADREGMLSADMERGIQESHERLDELLATDLVTG